MSDDDFLSKKKVRLHVYRLPDQLATDYCFGGGNPISFLNVDFFDVPWNVERDQLKKFIEGKRYFDRAARFLVLATPEYPTLTFTVEPAEATR